MAIRILCIADIHLGRRPTGLPGDVDPRTHGPADAWDAFVRIAIERRVDAVALTGDLVDESNHFYEAFSKLQAGVERLSDADIPAFAVAGNHDWDELPRLAGQLAGFHLLGPAGQWEEAFLERDGERVLRFQGWSFPARHVRDDPLTGYGPPPADGLPTVGLLHADCNADPSSPYAPVALSALRNAPVSAWVLGHIHTPRTLSERPLILYPGSPQGLDPGETGAHGASLVTIAPDGQATAEFVPLASLRWEPVDVALDTVSDKSSFDTAVLEALRARHEAIRSALSRTDAVGCRLALIGRTPFHRELAGEREAIANLSISCDDTTYFVEKVVDRSRPDLALDEIARASDPAGLLARRLVVLDRQEPADDFRALIDDARARMDARRNDLKYARLPDAVDDLSDEAVRQTLVAAGFALLENLLAQKEGRA